MLRWRKAALRKLSASWRLDRSWHERYPALAAQANQNVYVANRMHQFWWTGGIPRTGAVYTMHVKICQSLEFWGGGGGGVLRMCAICI